MYKVKFDTGEIVSFEKEPTDADIEEVVKTLNIKPQSASIPKDSRLDIFAEQKMESTITDKLKGVAKIGMGLIKPVSPMMGTETGQKILKGALKMGIESTKPFLQPFAMATGKDIPLPLTESVKATPTSKEALIEAGQVAMLGLPIEKAIMPVAKTLLTPVGKGFKYVSSIIGGYPKEMLEKIFQYPELLSKSIKEAAQTPDYALKLYNKARQALQNTKQLRTESYTKSLEDLQKNYWKTQAGKQYLKDEQGIWQPIDLSLKGVKDTITKTLRQFDVIVKDAKKGLLNFLETPIPRNQQKELLEVTNRVYNWQNISPLGLNKLKKVIDGYYKGGSDTLAFDKIITTIKKNLSSYVGEKVPQIAKMEKDYSLASEFIDQVSKEFKLEPGQSIETAINSLISVFNKNSPYRQGLIEQLGAKGSEEIFDDIIALTMKDWLPKGRLRQLFMAGGALTGAFLRPETLLGIPVVSPRISAGLTAAAGKVFKKAPEVISKLKMPIRGLTASLMEKLK